MADYRQFAGQNGVVFVEVESIPGGAGSNSGDLKDLLRPIGDIVAVLSAQQGGGAATDQARPEIEVRFGVKGLSDGRIVIALDGTGNFQVRISWKPPQGVGGFRMGAGLPGT